MMRATRASRGDEAPASPSRRQSFYATCAMQAAFGASYAAFGVAIPAIKARAHLDNGALSLLLTLQAVGGVAAMPGSAPLYRKFGARGSIGSAALALALVMAGAAHNTDFVAGCIWFALLGPLTGGIKVFLDTAAIGLERPERPVLGKSSAAYSAGVLFGSGVAALCFQARIAGPAVIYGACTMLVAVTAITGRATRRRSNATGDSGPRALRSTAPPQSSSRVLAAAAPFVARAGRASNVHLLYLCLAMGLGNLVAGGVLRWLNVYLTAELAAPGGSGGAALTACHMATLVGQLVGDRWVPRLQLSTWCWAGGLASAAALGLGLLDNAAWSVAGGGVVAMLGLANLPPAINREIARRWTGARQPTAASWVNGTRSAATLLGSPLIGGLAHVVGLRAGLSALCVASLGNALVGLSLRRAHVQMAHAAPGRRAVGD